MPPVGLRTLLALIPLASLACGSRASSSSSDGTGSATESASTSTATVTGTSTSTSTGTGPDTDTGPAACPEVPGYECPLPVDCEAFPCGGIDSTFDEDGCLRASCGNDRDCGPDEVCFVPFDWGQCVSSGCFCSLDPNSGECQCGCDPDCGGRYCVPADIAPPALCFDFDNEGECLAAGCSEFASAQPVMLDGECSCGAPEGYCLWFPGGIGGAASPAAFYRLDTSDVAMFATAYDTPPLGWARCSEAANPPVACDCYADFMGCP